MPLPQQWIPCKKTQIIASNPLLQSGTRGNVGAGFTPALRFVKMKGGDKPRHYNFGIYSRIRGLLTV